MPNNPRHISLFRSIHRIRQKHPSEEIGFDRFWDVWASFINDVTGNALTELVNRSGYPIATDKYNSLGHFKREGIESNIIEAIQRGNNIFLVGCEGSGKTTLCHSVAGHSYFQKHSYANRMFVYINGMAMPPSTPSISDYLSESILHSIRTSNYFSKYLEECENYFNNIRANRKVDEVSFKMDTARQYITCFLAHFRIIHPNVLIYVIIDNMDSFNSRNIFRTLGTSKRITDQITDLSLFMEKIDGKLQEKDRLEYTSNLRFVLPVRNPTYMHAKSASAGLFPMKSSVELSVEDDLRDKISIWSLLRQYLLNEKIHDLKYINENAKMFIPIRKDVNWIPQDIPESIKKLLSILSNEIDYSDMIIKKYCGRSIRRYKMYGLKLLGHFATWRILFWIENNTYDHKNHKRVFNRMLSDALYDFMQPIGRIGTSDFGQFHLNLFQICWKDHKFDGDSLIGVYIIRYIHTQKQRIFTNEAFAHKIDVSELLVALWDLQYDNGGISKAFHAFWVSGVLRPITTSERIIVGVDAMRGVYKEYVVDERAVESYYNLAHGTTDIVDTLSYMSAAMRYRLTEHYSTYLFDLLYYAFGSLCLLSHMKNEEKDVISRSKNVSSLRNLGILPYTPMITSSVRDKITGIVLQREGEIQADPKKEPYMAREVIASCKELLSMI